MSTSGHEIRFSAQLERHTDTDEVFFTISGEPDHSVLVFAPESFLVGLLWPLMRQGLSLRVDASVDADLLYQINTEVIPLLRSTDQRLSEIEITAPTASGSLPASNRTGAATGMSCGLDSFATLRESKSAECPPSRRIERLLFHSVGQAGRLHREQVHLERLGGHAQSLRRKESH